MIDPSTSLDGDGKPRRYILQERIKFIAEHSERVKLTMHAQERMVERDISSTMVFRVLKQGVIEGDIKPGKKPGDWKAKVVAKIRGHREAGVVTAVLKEDELVVITVEWEDWRSR